MTRTFLAALVAALVLPAVASATSFTKRTLSDAHVGRSKPELVAQVSYSSRVVASLRRSWKVAPRHATCWTHVPWAHVCNRARQRLHAQRWLGSVAQRRLERLYPTGPTRSQYPAISRWMLDAFTCIHRGEGSWSSETGNGFHGGLQADSMFEEEYGPEFLRRWGHAGNWPAWAQLIAGVRAHDGWPAAPDPRARSARGFGPWPNTARACGLL